MRTHPSATASGRFSKRHTDNSNQIPFLLVYIINAITIYHSLRVVSPDKTYTLQAEDELDKQEWMSALQSVIAVLLDRHDLHTPGPSGGQPRTPSRPTHTRTASGTVSLEEYDKALDGTKSPFAPHSATSMKGNEGPSSRPRSPTQPRPTSPSPRAMLRAVRGNHECAECGAADPDWASLNLGILLCIECSGVHRNLGVHLSKVRSLTLDVAVWQPHVLQLFSQLGNAEANALWEANLAAVVNQVRRTGL